MNKLLWLSDIHLNALVKEARIHFYETLAKQSPNNIIITGDIGEATSFITYLNEFAHFTQNCHTYFVLGNHDFYKGDYRVHVIHKAKMLGGNIHYLPGSLIKLSDSTCLIGTNGIGDGGYGNFINGFDNLNNYRLIMNFIGEFPNRVQELIQSYLKDDIRELEPILHTALINYQTIYFATHVIPFAQGHPNSRHDSYCDTYHSDWIGHYTCKAVGDCILKVMDQYPDKKMIILCGHSHLPWQGAITDNIYMKVAYAEYYQPKIQEVITIEE